MLSTIVIQTPFDPQYLYIAFSFVADVFGSASWINIVKMFLFIAVISGFISAVAFRKYDFIQQFLITLVFTSLLAVPVNEPVAFKRGDTERVWVTSNNKASFILIQGFKVVNDVTRFFTEKAGSSLSNPTYTGMFDAGIGGKGNVMRNSLEVAFDDPEVRSDLVQFIKECALYDIRDGQYNIKDLKKASDGFEVILKNTSPARFVTVKSITGSSELKTCQQAGLYLNGKVNTEALKVIEEKSKLFFYKDGGGTGGANFPTQMYAIAVEGAYRDQLNINQNVTNIMRQNMFSYLMEVSGSDMAVMLKDPSMAESAAVHMGVARSAKKAAFNQSIVAQLGRQTLPAMASWFAVILIMLFPFAVILFIVGSLQTSLAVMKGYFSTLFWVCLWQPIFAIIDNLGNWELHRQLMKTSAAGADGIPFGYIHTVHDTLINNHSLIGWMVMLTPVIAAAVAWGSYRGVAGMASSAMGVYGGSTSSVGNEMSDGNVSMGNTNMNNKNLGNATENVTSANKLDSNIGMASGGTMSTDGHGGNYKGNTNSLFETHDKSESLLGEYSFSNTAGRSDSQQAGSMGRGEVNSSDAFVSSQTAQQGSTYSVGKDSGTNVSTGTTEGIDSRSSMFIGHSSGTTNTDGSSNTISSGEGITNQVATHVGGSAGVNLGASGGGGGSTLMRDTEGNQQGSGGGGNGGRRGGGAGRGNIGASGNLTTGLTNTRFGNTSVDERDARTLETSNTDSATQGANFEQSATKGVNSSSNQHSGTSQSLVDSQGYSMSQGSSKTTAENNSASKEYNANSTASSGNTVSRMQNLSNPAQISKAMDELSGDQRYAGAVEDILSDNGFASRDHYNAGLNTKGALGVQEDIRALYSGASRDELSTTSSMVGNSYLPSSQNDAINTFSGDGDRLIGAGKNAVDNSIAQNKSKGSSMNTTTFGVGAGSRQDGMTGQMGGRRDNVSSTANQRSASNEGGLQEDRPIEDRGYKTGTRAGQLVNPQTGELLETIENAPQNIKDGVDSVVDGAGNAASAGKSIVDSAMVSSAAHVTGWLGAASNWSEQTKKP